MGEKSKTGNAWVNFILIFVMGAIFAIGFFKVPPAMGSLMEYFQCGLGEAGWFMSACSVAGTVIAFATGAIQTKIGPKGMLIAALVCMALDSLVGVLVGLFTNIVPPALFSNAQWAAKTPAGVALVMAALPIGSNFGGIPAAPIAGAIVESTGSWAMVAVPLGIVGAVGLVCAVVFMARCGKYAVGAAKAEDAQ